MDYDNSSIFEGRIRRPLCELCRKSADKEKCDRAPVFNSNNLHCITSTTELDFAGPQIEMFVKETLDSVSNTATNASSVQSKPILEISESTTTSVDDKRKRKKKLSSTTSNPIMKGQQSSANSVPEEIKKTTHSSNMNQGNQKKSKHAKQIYKTPAELQREQDQRHDKMVDAAEAQDQVNRLVAVQRLEAERRKNLNILGPLWYQELSNQQLNLAESLGGALKADIEEGHVSRTRRLLAAFGLLPNPSKKDVHQIATMSFGNPILFLAYLARKLAPVKRKRDDVYPIRERLLLSALAHLAMPRTLIDLHSLLPPPPKVPQQHPKGGGKDIIKKKQMHTSPYLQPQVLVAAHQSEGLEESIRQRESASITECRKQVLKALMKRKSMQNERSGEFEATPMYEQSKSLVLNDHSVRFITSESTRKMTIRDRKSNFFKNRFKQLNLLATSIHDNEAEPNLEEFEFQSIGTHTIGVNSYASFDSAYHTALQFEKVLRYSTSTEPPVMAASRPLSVPMVPVNSVESRPMPSIAEHERPSAALVNTKEPSGLDNTLNERAVDMVLMGYFNALPQEEVYNAPRPTTFNTRDPSKQIHTIVKRALARLAKEGNPLAALPQAHRLPYIRKWLLRRSGFKLTHQVKVKMQTLSEKQVGQCLNHPRQAQVPETFLTAKQIQELTYDGHDWFKKKANKILNNYYGCLRAQMVDDAREYWPSMCMNYFDNKEFRNVFFAYLPAKETDTIPIHP